MNYAIESPYREAEDALIKLDPVLGGLIKLQRPMARESHGEYFAALCRSIIGQQVSVAAASTIFARLEATTGLQPQAVSGLLPEQVKNIGLSRQKASYLHDLAEHFVANPKVYDHLEKLSDAEVIADLTAIKGIGVWTAQMFLMFTLMRPDVFAPDDFGLQRAMKQLYGWDDIPKKKELETFAERWRPYRTVACWHLWESLNNRP
jgi:DNA-3-methyladenine glycosylase II